MTAPLLAQATGSTAEVVLFVVFAGLAIGGGVGMVVMRNVVHGALMLVVNLLSLAGLYLVLQSSFLSIIQVIVYAGAIMVLFLFVIMLLGIDRDDLLVEVRTSHRVLAVLGAVALVGFVGWGTVGPYTGAASLCRPGDQVRTATTQSCAGMDDALAAADRGSVEVLANDLFTRWTFPFEAAALLLVVATIGAMLLGRRRETDPRTDPAWEPSIDLPDEQAASPGTAEEADDGLAGRVDPVTSRRHEAPIESADGGEHAPVGTRTRGPATGTATAARPDADPDGPDVASDATSDDRADDDAGDAVDGRAHDDGGGA